MIPTAYEYISKLGKKADNDKNACKAWFLYLKCCIFAPLKEKAKWQRKIKKRADR
jgi:hypothetical protein